jgi:hypothetical protein
MDPKTVRRGLTELELPDDLAQSRVRKKGGGANVIKLRTNSLNMI